MQKRKRGQSVRQDRCQRDSSKPGRERLLQKRQPRRQLQPGRCPPVLVAAEQRAGNLKSNYGEKEQQAHDFPAAAAREPMLDREENQTSEQNVEHCKQQNDQSSPRREVKVRGAYASQYSEAP